MYLLRSLFIPTGRLLTLFLLWWLLLPGGLRAQAPAGDYSRVRVWLGPGGLRAVAALGVAVDHGEGKAGVWFESDFSAAELARLRAASLRCDVLIPDVQTFYRQRNALPAPAPRPQSGVTCDPQPTYRRPQSFRLGSMGGFFTYDEILEKLDSMRLRWPNLISVKQPTGALRTINGEPVYWVRISDNPGTDENEPEMLYNGVHHAREPMSAASLIYYMYYLLENYSRDPEIRNLINNTELYFIPCVNPDGYMYNEANNPSGGGMWRKNRRLNADGTEGVDLNRNYGASWGFDNVGSSPSGWSETYRGTAAFSEPETRIMRDFSLQHQFKVVLNYHSFGNVFIYPYGYQPNTYTPDSAQFTDYGFWLTRADRYTFGTCNQVLGYISNGDANDWQYNTVQGTKPKAFSFTPEIGKASEGFWPASSRIEPLCYENLTRNLDAAKLLLADAILTDRSPRFFRQRAAYVRYSIKQLGLKTPGSYTVRVTPLTGAGTAGAQKTYSLTTVRQERTDSIRLTLPTALSPGQTFRYVLSVDNGLFVRRDTLTKVFGTPTVVFSADGSSMTGWRSSGSWGVDASVAHTGGTSLGDSPAGDYFDDDSSFITTTQSIDLRGATRAQLSFWARWAIEARFDYAQVLVSANGGTSWQPLCGRYTRPGNAFQRQDEPIYDGFQFSWVPIQYSLDEFAGRQILLRFLLHSDDASAFDGFNVDDIRVEKIGTLTGLPEVAAPPVLLNAYPNPTHDAVSITFHNLPAEGGTLAVHDAVGRVAWSGGLSGGATRQPLDVRAWPPGLYAAVVRAPGRHPATVRFVVGD